MGTNRTRITIPGITIDEAEDLSKECDYAAFAVENACEINTADASAFYLEGYNEALRRLRAQYDFK